MIDGNQCRVDVLSVVTIEHELTFSVCLSFSQENEEGQA